ncbi:hypothetical protein HPB48_014996 [Haemaphysalis longicornis]|uniref:Peptidyl-prolyl cis-trans isomerase n=1 Tax=Haemaphysalis longicornis TaxID=44386 RepID=A0A9J6FI94_HAELO|nr:hypothetical protein HPB48_014996 [Haemaphysalis longicornis]
MCNPTFSIDVEDGGEPLGRIVMDLRADVASRTAENSRALCTREKGFGHEGSAFRRAIPNSLRQGHNGTGGKSTYCGNKFEDENFQLKRTAPRILSIAHASANTNGWQFFLTTAKASWRDGKYAAFASVAEGTDVTKKVENFIP